MDRRGFVTSGMAAGLAGFSGASGALGTLLDRAPGFARGKTLANGDIRYHVNDRMDLFASDGFRDLFTKSFGQLTDPVRTFFMLSALPE